MRETMILYAHPAMFEIVAEEGRRFSGTRTSFFGRLHAAWLVFSGQADALMWDGEYCYGDPRAASAPKAGDGEGA